MSAVIILKKDPAWIGNEIHPWNLFLKPLLRSKYTNTIYWIRAVLFAASPLLCGRKIAWAEILQKSSATKLSKKKKKRLSSGKSSTWPFEV